MVILRSNRIHHQDEADAAEAEEQQLATQRMQRQHTSKRLWSQWERENPVGPSSSIGTLASVLHARCSRAVASTCGVWTERRAESDETSEAER
jgi:isoaspartyl peptidase/L-asparaginase-like protein (Ntn-hydrolase superfamily)